MGLLSPSPGPAPPRPHDSFVNQNHSSEVMRSGSCFLPFAITSLEIASSLWSPPSPPTPQVLGGPQISHSTGSSLHQPRIHLKLWPWVPAASRHLPLLPLSLGMCESTVSPEEGTWNLEPGNEFWCQAPIDGEISQWAPGKSASPNLRLLISKMWGRDTEGPAWETQAFKAWLSLPHGSLEGRTSGPLSLSCQQESVR